MARKSEHSGLNENVPDTQDAKKIEGTSEVTSSKGNALLLRKCPLWISDYYSVTSVLYLFYLFLIVQGTFHKT